MRGLLIRKMKGFLKVQKTFASFHISSSKNIYFIEEDIRNQLHDDDDHKQGRRLVEELEKIIGYKFKNSSLLCEAFTHSSFKENCKSYERLELLGDSILNMLIIKEEFLNYPDLTPGKLTKLRAANVDNEKLARVAIKYNLHNYLLHKNPLLKGQVEEFRKGILEYPIHSLGLIDSPKVLADVVESLIGAISIDSNCMDTTWKVVKVLLQPLITLEKLEVNPITKLYELCQKNGLKTKFIDQWEKTREVEVYVDEKFVGRGKSFGKKITAKSRAAHNAYHQVVRNLSMKVTIVDEQLCDETQN